MGLTIGQMHSICSIRVGFDGFWKGKKIDIRKLRSNFCTHYLKVICKNVPGDNQNGLDFKDSKHSGPAWSIHSCNTTTSRLLGKTQWLMQLHPHDLKKRSKKMSSASSLSHPLFSAHKKRETAILYRASRFNNPITDRRERRRVWFSTPLHTHTCCSHVYVGRESTHVCTGKASSTANWTPPRNST